METQRINVFVLADNALVVNGLRHYLEDRFGDGINITGFYDNRSCLKKISDDTHIVVLDYFIGGRSGMETLRCIRAINSETEVIMHSSNEDVAVAINAYTRGEKGLFNISKKYTYQLAKQYS
jgi:DNA-binding NarL/FixJ family response regulator